MRVRVGLWAMAGLAVLLAGCTREVVYESAPWTPTVTEKDYYRPLPPGAHALRKIEDPSLYPDFRPGFEANRPALLIALEYSIRYFDYPSSHNYFPVQDISHQRARISVEAFRDLVVNASSAEEFQARLVSDFDVYQSVGCDDRGTVLFTGYYTPIFDARLEPDSEYRWPLYRLPDDLVKGPDGQCLGRRVGEDSIVPYYTRAEIERGALAGYELAYVKSRFEAYICTVQGSAKLRLENGELLNVGYHGNNGHPYTSVGQLLIQDGRMSKDKLSLKGLIAFFDAHPDVMDAYLPKNARTVFFQETASEPTGSLNLPVTAYASVATDKSIFPRACVAFAETRVPQAMADDSLEQQTFHRFLLDQDTGGAIRAAGRADIYLGVGDQAGRIAGWTFSEGRLYYVFLKDGKY